MCELSLFYLGARDYVNGLTLFESMTQAWIEQVGKGTEFPVTVESFKVNRFVRSHARMKVVKGYEPSQRIPEAREAATRIQLRSGDETTLLLLVPTEDEREVPRLEDCDRTRYLTEVEGFGEDLVSAGFTKVHNAFDLLRGIVEVNQQLTMFESRALGVQRSPSWAYMNQYVMLPDEEAARVDRATFRLESVLLARDKRYTVRKIDLSCAGSLVGELELCYFTPAPENPTETPAP